MKFQKSILILFIAGLLTACVNNNTPKAKEGFTTITGVLGFPNQTEVNLSKVENGDITLVSTSYLNDNNQFGFTLNPDSEGFYLVGNKGFEIPLYIKGNQTFDMSFTPDGYDLSTIPDKENEVLFNWYKSNDTLKTFKFGASRATYKEFFPFYEKFIPEMKKQHDLVNTSNERFNELMHAYIDLNIEKVAVNFVFTPRAEHPKKGDFPPFFDEFMKGDNFKSTIVLDIPYGIATLRLHQMFNNLYVKDFGKVRPTEAEMLEGIPNDILKAYSALQFLPKFTAYNESYLNFIEPLRAAIAKDEYLTKKIDEFEVSIKTTTPGTQGYPWTYEDINGKKVSFSDFKGKYVYIDAWATWCAPCKSQIPYLKKLEQEFHGKDIVFVSVSLDKPKDKAKWSKFVIDEQLGGVQLFADAAFDSRIAKDYKINAIPRFLLFDKEGKIIDAKAARPSQPQLRAQLQKLLN
ncbi:TlpA family protein disulfide reductase [Gaetbulibacter saemankumensis]|uniref:TlpA family protein disulfide reductase n=1 Tax=Gaetbulibacter saemankumensis TaxID=311208 RepID=UPI00040D1A59|nr:TlpA disulfide reductase family protein [Gaetbulibacter saemankumensis]